MQAAKNVGQVLTQVDSGYLTESKGFINSLLSNSRCYYYLGFSIVDIRPSYCSCFMQAYKNESQKSGGFH